MITEQICDSLTFIKTQLFYITDDIFWYFFIINSIFKSL